MAAAAPVPAQYKPQPVTDFRAFSDGPRGYKVGITKKGVLGQKRRLDEYAEQVEIERETLPAAEELPIVGPTKKPKHDTIGLAKESGRSWRLPGERAGSLRNPKLSSNWDKKMKAKAEKAAFVAQKREAQAVYKAKKAEARASREASRRQKEENRKASDITVRVSSETAKRMLKSKKGRKQLRTA